MENCIPEGENLELLPSAILATIMAKLDVASICSVAATCKTFNGCASQVLSFLPCFHLLDIAPSIDLLRPLLPPNPYLRSLKVDCSQLSDSSIEHLVRPYLNELCLHNCQDFSGKLLSEVGGRCKDLRTLYLGSVAEKRGRAIHISDLEELLGGCTQLERPDSYKIHINKQHIDVKGAYVNLSQHLSMVERVIVTLKGEGSSCDERELTHVLFEEILSLLSLSLMFDVSIFLRHNFGRVWAMASEKLSALEIGYISSVMVTELLSPTVGSYPCPNYVQSPILPHIQKLCLSVDYITDTLVGTISKGLVLLTHLDLRDAPMIEPTVTFDLTNPGLQQINQHGKLKHLCLIRSQEFISTYFRRVNDLGVLLMADKCSNIESIHLGGFCRVTDAGFRAILHSCSSLHNFRVFHGTQLTDLVFHDITATSLSLTSVSLRWCNLITNLAVVRLVSNMDLSYLDLRVCRNLGDEALQAVSTLPKLKTLLLDGSDITDIGLSYLRHGVMKSLVSLSIRGCKRLTDKCISAIFYSSSGQELQDLDLSNIPNLSDNAILLLAKSRVMLTELRLRECPLIGDTSIMALASMQIGDGGWHGSILRLLDLYDCRGITQLAIRWLKKPYFPRLRWLGLTGSVNRDMVDALARSRPFLHMACRGEELGSDHWDSSDGLYGHDEEEVDELEQWLLEVEESGGEEREDDENDNEMEG